jgi:glycosyltransferase involved in cell wall biosynthesis
MHAPPAASIVLPTHNRVASIAECLESLLTQTEENIEIIVVDDASTDSTVDVVRTYADTRVTLILRSERGGPAAARNTGVRSASSEIIFFTDDDVVLPSSWVREGLRYFLDESTIGFEGRVVYVSDDYHPTWSDRVVENKTGGHYMTANAAYRRKTLIACGLFHEGLGAFRDRELALRARQLGAIRYADEVVVTHRRDIYTLRTFMGEGRKARWRPYLYKQHKDRATMLGPVYGPARLLTLLCPALLLLRLRHVRIASTRDLCFFLLMYPRLAYERINLWAGAASQHALIV